MPMVWVPALLRPLTQGREQLQVPGRTVRQVVESLDLEYPGLAERLCDDQGRLRPEIAVVVDGETAIEGLRAAVGPDSELTFLPALSGG